MAELFGVQPPKKRKIQTIFLGSFNAPSAQPTPSTSAEQQHLRNATATPSSASAPPLLAPAVLARPSSSSTFSSFVPSTIERFSPVRPIPSRSPNGRTQDEQRNECQNGGQQKSVPSKWANTASTTTAKCEIDAETLLNHSSTSLFSMEGRISSLDDNATVATNGEEQRRPPLPELNLESGAKLRSVPQLCHLQSNANNAFELPTPQPQRELEFRLKMGTSAQIDRIVVQNSLSNKRTLKSARIVAKFGRDTKWQYTVPSPVLLIHSNRVWTVLCLEDKSLVVLHSQTGRVSCSLHTQSVLALLELRDHFCFAVGTDASAQLWDLQRLRSLFRASIRSLFGYSPDVPRIVQAFVSAKGLPVVVLSNGDAFVYSLSLQSWLSFHIDHEFIASKLCAMQSVASILPDGLIGVLLNASKIEKASNFVPQRMEVAAAKEESEMEMLLRMTRELDSWEEYRFLAVIYVQLLISREKRAKLVEFLAELRSLSRAHNEFPFSTIVADLSPLLATEEGIDAGALLGRGGKCTETTKRRETSQDGGATERTLASLLTHAD